MITTEDLAKNPYNKLIGIIYEDNEIKTIMFDCDPEIAELGFKYVFRNASDMDKWLDLLKDMETKARELHPESFK